MAGHSFDNFIDNLADVSAIDENDPTAFFIKSFKQPNDILLNQCSLLSPLGKARVWQFLEAGDESGRINRKVGITQRLFGKANYSQPGYG